MKLEELAQILGREKVTLGRNFPRTQQALAKKGIIITKWGWGEDAEYEIEYEEREEEE